MDSLLTDLSLKSCSNVQNYRNNLHPILRFKKKQQGELLSDITSTTDWEYTVEGELLAVYLNL